MNDFEFNEDYSIRTGELTEKVLAHFGCTGDTYRGGQKFIGMTQIRADAGWDVQTGDVVIMGAWGSTNHDIQGFEVKISRSDWLNEVKKPNKNDEIKQYCDKFWLVIADESMVKEGELPEDWGMMVPSGSGLKVIKKAPRLEPIPVTKGFMVMMMRANQSETIPLDVHNDKIKDVEREHAKQNKEYYAGLISFIKEINKELGIRVEHNSYRDSWYVSIDNWELRREFADGADMNPQQLAQVVKAILNDDLKSIKYKLERAAESAKDILKVAGEFKDAEGH